MGAAGLGEVSGAVASAPVVLGAAGSGAAGLGAVVGVAAEGA